MSKQEATRLADVLDSAPLVTNGTMRSSAALLRRQSERIAALEAALEQARVALEEMQYARTDKAERLTAEALRAIEEVRK